MAHRSSNFSFSVALSPHIHILHYLVFYRLVLSVFATNGKHLFLKSSLRWVGSVSLAYRWTRLHTLINCSFTWQHHSVRSETSTSTKLIPLSAELFFEYRKNGRVFGKKIQVGVQRKLRWLHESSWWDSWIIYCLVIFNKTFCIIIVH